MFKRLFVTAFILILLVAYGVLGAHLHASEPTPDSASSRPRIALSLPALAFERWHRDLDNMVSQAESLGIDLLVQISTHDQNQQNFAIEQLITMGIDVLIIAPQDSFAVGSVVERARDAGIKVISYDRLIMNANLDLYVSYDNLAIGKLQGRFLVQNAGKGDYILLNGPKYDSNAQFYKEGALAELQPYIDSGEIRVVLERDIVDWDQNTAKDLVESALVRHHRDIAAILAANDGIAAGAITALRQSGLQGKVFVTGQDAELGATKRIMDGSQSMTIFKDISREVEVALQAAILLAKGEGPDGLTQGRTVNNLRHDVPAILLEPVVIDKENLNDVLLRAGHIREEIIASTSF